AAPVEPIVVETAPVEPAPLPEGELIVQRNIPLQEAKVDDNGLTVIEFTIPADTFAHTAELDYMLSAVLVDGSELPAWLVFDADKGEFRGIAPEGFEGVIEIRVIARDDSGRQVETEVRIEIKKGATNQMLGKLHVLDQMQQDDHFSWKQARDKWIAQAKQLANANRLAS
ncbi:MAG TPA: putative Ig domain-containing protein, partial [Pseudomonadales bacterium]|nr:putative Ig domain-containing protein [Pseudomonadales bacterium]